MKLRLVVNTQPSLLIETQRFFHTLADATITDRSTPNSATVPRIATGSRESRRTHATTAPPVLGGSITCDDGKVRTETTTM